MTEIDLADLQPGTLHLYYEDPDDSPSFWMSEDVRDAVLSTVAAGQPVVYVDCGGWRESACDELREMADSPLLRVVHDDDLDLTLPAGHAGVFDPRHGPWETAPCETPSVWLASRAVAEHERVHGPALLVLDHVEKARPYYSATDPNRSGPRVAALRITAQQARLWAAGDLTRLARARRDAPTVVVTRCLLHEEDINTRLAEPAPEPPGHPHPAPTSAG